VQGLKDGARELVSGSLIGQQLCGAACYGGPRISQYMRWHPKGNMRPLTPTGGPPGPPAKPWTGMWAKLGHLVRRADALHYREVSPKTTAACLACTCKLRRLAMPIHGSLGPQTHSHRPPSPPFPQPPETGVQDSHPQAPTLAISSSATTTPRTPSWSPNCARMREGWLKACVHAHAGWLHACGKGCMHVH
jgi:hypothetical protein